MIVIFMVIGIAVMMLLSLSLVLFFLLSQRKLHNEKIKAQALAIQHQQDLLEGNLRVQEAERQRIASQLHDDVCSKLGVLNLTFHRLHRTDPESPTHEGLFQEINRLIAETLDTTRQISHELVPPTLEGFGLPAALSELCAQIQNTGAVDISLENNVLRSDFANGEMELHLFRIVQELANNSLKHANANAIHIFLDSLDDKIRLLFRDDGKGFDMDGAPAKGLGLKNIENRAKMIGAETQLVTAAGNGFEMKFVIPKTM